MNDSPPEPTDGDGVSVTKFSDLDLQGGESTVVPSPTTVAFFVGLAAIAAGFSYEYVLGNSLPFASGLEPLDWLLAASLVAVVAFVVVPLATDRRQTLRYWRRLRRRPGALFGLGFVLVLAVVGLVGPMVLSRPESIHFDRAYQPPIGFTVDTKWLFTSDACIGPIHGGQCHGTFQYPLGTTRTGQDMIPFVVLGAHTTLKVALVATTLIVPTGSAVGRLAAYGGGRVDAVLMRIAATLQTIPAIVVYILFWGWNAEYRLLVLVAAFGLTSWGGLARLVRNEAIQLRDRDYVAAARGSGASRWYVVRQHLLPNVSRAVLTNVTLQVPLLVFTEAALAFIVVTSPFNGEQVALGDGTVVSWGETINLGVHSASQVGGWWIATIPALLLVLTMLAFNLLGRGLGEVLDPRPK